MGLGLGSPPRPIAGAVAGGGCSKPADDVAGVAPVVATDTGTAGGCPVEADGADEAAGSPDVEAMDVECVENVDSFADSSAECVAKI